MIKENELALCHCKNVPEARQYGSKHKLSSVAKVEPEAGQYAPSPLEGEGLGEGFKKRAAFTLAEVLITLGIIGVVAAMTIPTLVKNYQTKITVTRMKKVYSALSQVYKFYMVDNDVMADSFVGLTQENAEKIAQIFLPYLKISKDCGTGVGCFYNGTYKYRNGNDWTNIATNTNKYKILLADGSAILFFGYPSDNAKYKFQIMYDVNGTAGPNQWGYDLFNFVGTANGIEPSGLTYTTDEQFLSGCARNSSQGYSCANWVISKGNLDYLDCPDTISLNSSGCSK